MYFFMQNIDKYFFVKYDNIKIERRKTWQETTKVNISGKRKNMKLLNGNIDKQLGIELKKKLKEDGMSVANWITENAKKYLKK